jgi:Ca-activated chloride channel family protein
MRRASTLNSGWIERLGRIRRPAQCACIPLIFSLALLCGRTTAQEQEPRAAQTIQVNVDRVNVGVIVTNAKGNFLEGLQRKDFQVFDNGATQPITEFAPVDAPGQVLLIVEAGPAVYLLQDQHLFVADALLNGLSPGDRVAIARYNDAAVALLGFTADKGAAQAALDGIRFNLGYGDLNLSASLNTALDWLVRTSGKKTIVLVSTGVDTSPAPVMQELLARLQTGDVRILAVSMTGPFRGGKKNKRAQYKETEEALAQADTWLTRLAQATGGRAYFPENAKAFQETYRQIAQFVRHEYSLAFAPPAADGAVHSIEVKVDPGPSGPKGKAPEYRVDHRKAYVAPKSTE